MIENNIKMKNIKNSIIPLVSIIILNYNAGNLLTNCVDSIKKTNYDNYEIIIVDNDSNDDSHIECSKKFPEISLLENKKIWVIVKEITWELEKQKEII